MKQSIYIITALLTLSAAVATAQPKPSPAAVAALKEDNSRAGAVTNSYEFRPIKDTPAPKGYKPFYISHYGRHGSRSNWGGRSYENVIKTMQTAKEKGILTPSGDSLMHEAQRVLDCWGGMDGHLSQKGVREHQAIAQRMYDRYPEVFKGDKKVRAYGSMVQRCLISMNSFTIGLAKRNPKLQFRLDTGEQYQKYINPGDEWHQISGHFTKNIREYVAQFPEDTVYTMKRLFTDPEAAREFVKSPRRLMDDIYSTAMISEDWDIEENIYRFLPFDAIYKRWVNANLDIYCHHGNSVEFGEATCALAEPTIQDVIAKADEVIASGEYAADLRFGHDHPLMKIVGYLGIEGVGERYRMEDVCDNWLGFWNMCMASNLQMIFYKNKSGDVLVKFLYQEQETKLRKLEPLTGPYYRWEDVKANIKGYLR